MKASPLSGRPSFFIRECLCEYPGIKGTKKFREGRADGSGGGCGWFCVWSRLSVVLGLVGGIPTIRFPFRREQTGGLRRRCGGASCVFGRICIWAMFRKDVSKRRLRFAIAAFSFTRKNICRENVRPADLDLGFG